MEGDTAETKRDLLRQICDRPDDDAPRLVYADLLVAEGDPHGEFIAVQCELARLGFPSERLRASWIGEFLGDLHAIDSGRLETLRARERELLARHGEQWASEVHARGLEAGFERGFLEHVGYKDAKTVENLGYGGEFTLERFLETAPMLRSLHLAHNVPGPMDAPRLDRLRDLSLPLAQVARGIGTCETLTGLRRLKLNVGRAKVQNARMEHPYQYERPEDNVRALVRASWFPGVRALDVSDVELGPRLFAEILGEGHGEATFRELHLRSNKLGVEGANLLARSPAVSDLQVLSLHRNAIGYEGARALASSTHLQQLRALNLRKTRIGEAGVAALASAFPHLRVLDLSDNELGERDVVTLLSGKGLRELRVLCLRNNAIGDRGAEALAASDHLKNLRLLDVSGNAIQEPGMEALARSRHLAGARVITETPETPETFAP